VNIAAEAVPSATAVGQRTLEILERRRSSPFKRRGRLVRAALLMADLAGLTAAFLITELVFGNMGPHDTVSVGTETALFVVSLPIWVIVAKLYRLYDHDDERTDHTTLEDLVGVFHLVTVGTWIVIAGGWLLGLADPKLNKLLSFWLLAIVLVTGGRAIARTVCRRNLGFLQNTVIIGAGDVGQLVARKLLHHEEYGINLVGFVDGDPKELRADLGGEVPVLGAVEELPDIITRLDVERVIVAFSSDPPAKTVELVRAVRSDVQVEIVPRLYELVGPHVKVHTVESLPLVALPTAKRFPFSIKLKRFGDIVGALAGIVLTAPFFVYAAWRIKRESPGPVIFRQERLGKGMRPFTVYKFRTMRVDTDDTAHREFIRQSMDRSQTPEGNGLFKLERDDAITPFGHFLRKTSLDELPNFFNVLRGDMSLVGPRPCLQYETEHFQQHHFERFLVPAGITGLWQVTARAHATFGEALDMDVSYARNWSLGLDLWLLLRTPMHVLRRKGTA
jgi:exopolysaccharide biosynthesis polyprenyl glycosylphosphotransferase